MPVETILSKIARQKCVLMLGPDLYPVNGHSLAHHLRIEVAKRYSDVLEYHDEKEGFFLFQPGEKDEAEIEIPRYMHRLCQEMAYDETAYAKIARLPFHLIVSVSPDLFLTDTFYKYRVRHRFGYYKSRGGSATDEVAEPSMSEPLIYNLCGSVQHGSLLLDYEDLFLFLQSLLGVPGLPQKLKDALDDAETFLFLGFSFDRWYTQLLLRLLCGSRRLKKYAGKYQGLPDDTKAFLFHQFKIQFLDDGDQGDFLSRLIEAGESFSAPELGGAPFLRPLLDPAAPAEVSVIRHVQDGKIGNAIAELLRATEGTETANEAVLLRSRWSNFENERFKLDSRDAIVQYNQITDGVLKMAQQIF